MNTMLGSIESAFKSNDTHGACKLVWPGEGWFEGDKFVFDDCHQDFEPLILDAFTASTICKVYQALNSDNQKKVHAMVKESRHKFMRFVEFCWSKVK